MNNPLASGYKILVDTDTIRSTHHHKQSSKRGHLHLQKKHFVLLIRPLQKIPILIHWMPSRSLCWSRQAEVHRRRRHQRHELERELLPRKAISQERFRSRPGNFRLQSSFEMYACLLEVHVSIIPKISFDHAFPHLSPEFDHSMNNEDDCDIGLVLSDAPQFSVLECIAGSPAHASGRIKVGDVLLYMDSQNLSSRSLQEVYKALRGRAGSRVTLKFRRTSETNALVSLSVLKNALGLPDLQMLSLPELAFNSTHTQSGAGSSKSVDIFEVILTRQPVACVVHFPALIFCQRCESLHSRGSHSKSVFRDGSPSVLDLHSKCCRRKSRLLARQTAQKSSPGYERRAGGTFKVGQRHHDSGC
mmetsp:Transcript_3977/g.11520  ORF Transcript_3977/g.11520 Transcript_3977/m.11520 type:complete len:360 (+) Transcript_3977:521-1600(+)